MKTISRSKIVHDTSSDNPPAARVRAGEAVKFLTEDAYGGTIKKAGDREPAAMTGRGNPATGPLYVEGVKAGDVIAVEIVSVKPVGQATMWTGAGWGALGHKLSGEESVKLAVKGGFVHLDKKRKVKVDPMIGVIATATKGKAFSNAWPGEHGGNMDCNVITAGSVVYLPAAVDGALLSLGDIHTAQAAGEVAICAAEMKAEVVVKVRVSRKAIVTPAVERKNDISIIASAKTLDRAERLVLDKAFCYLTAMRGMEPHAAVRMLSLAGELEICQVVDPLKTLRVRIPRKYL